jgi:hypothetical protein
MSTTRGMTKTKPHQRPVAHSATTTTAIQTASSSRSTSDDFRCRRSQFVRSHLIHGPPYDQEPSGVPRGRIDANGEQLPRRDIPPRRTRRHPHWATFPGTFSPVCNHGGARSGICTLRCQCFHSFRATSGPVIRFRSGNVEAMIASEAASPPITVAQYATPGSSNPMPT